MTYVLKEEGFHKPKVPGGPPRPFKHYHVAVVFGFCNEVTLDPGKARHFRSKTLAEVYARNRLGSRWKPEVLPLTPPKETGNGSR